MTLLSSKQVSELVTNYEHQALVEKSRGYALSAFSNLVFARNRFEDIIKNNHSVVELKEQNIRFASNNFDIFQSVTEVLPNGLIISSDDKQLIPAGILEKQNQYEFEKVYLFISDNTDENTLPSINLILRHQQKTASHLYVAKLNSEYIWGDKLDYPSNYNICAYQLNNNAKTRLFCSTAQVSEINNEASTPINMGGWELFLAGEFNSEPWLIETKRLNPISQSHLLEFVGSKAYISITLLSLLVIGLLSLIQIRRTMVPLEQLAKSAKNISAGDFSRVEVDNASEFSELADAFNSMSSYIKQQLDTMESFSSIDKEIASNIDVEHAILLVMDRMQMLEPDAICLVAHLEEASASEVQCNCKVSGHALTTFRLSLPVKEINAIKQYNQGKIKQSDLSSEFVHERLLAELGANNQWTMPIFWQGELCAFLSVGSKTELDMHEEKWNEFRDLASRIGIVISSHEREQKLLLEAQYDNLTGLPNRILLQDRLKLAMEHTDHTGKPMWIVFIDLDRFKVINDSMGHTTGDALLVEIGRRLQAETRDTDTVARFGGDEFVIVLSGDAGENIQLSVLNRIMDAIAEPVYINNRELINSCSIGISVYPNDGKTSETLIKNADIAMYRAKELGRNNYQFFTQNLNDKASERMQMISLLRRAIDHDEFELHYQPKVDLNTNSIVGLEVLLRWHNATLGHVSPAKFIPVAEEAGLINVIGKWVLKTACKQIAIWQKSGLGKILVSVNLSARQLQQENLVEEIKSILIETEIKANCLELELTESMLMDNANNNLSTLHAIKSLGIQLSVDDFGTGYSNLAYLTTLPIDTLKIDKVFVDTVTINTEKAPIVDTIINLAKNMNLKVVAEGVETLEQTLYLKKQGCDQIQGYYFSKPLPTNEIRALLDANKQLEIPQLTLVSKKQ
jgi:diguanylate cyclase (GGDEF)-like protein